MSRKEDQEAIKEYVSRLPTKVQSNVTIVTAEEARTPFMLHITLDKNPVYVPRIGQRQGKTEDRTTPRVTVADTLLGCLIAYGMIPLVEIGDPWNRPKEYLNGYSIRRLPFEVCLKPTGRMVYDQIATNEHWLVGYDAEHQLYPSTRIGQFYVPEVRSKTLPTRENIQETVVRLALKETTWITDRIELPEGYYELIMKITSHTTYKGSFESIVKIDKKAYRGETNGLVLSPMSATNNVLKQWYNQDTTAL